MRFASLKARRGLSTGAMPLRRFCVLASTVLFLAACEEEQAEPVTPVRAIKTITVSERASGQERRFPGVVEAVDSSSLSFEVAGNVKELRFEAGDRVSQGDVLAVMDRQTFELNVQSSQASLGRARADFAEKRTEFERQDALYKKGWVARSAQEQALAAFDSARNQVEYARSQLNLARRDLEKTDLIAPFDGVVAIRHVDPFAEVGRGEAIYDVYAEGLMEVRISVPESSIRDLHLGLQARLRFPTLENIVAEGRVSEIGTSAGVANAFPVKVAVTDESVNILPGMTAEVSLLLGGEGDGSTFLVPISAIVPGEQPREGYVFVFDPESSQVKRVAIRGRGVSDNRIVITEGLSAGDVIAVAGVSFLQDGQEVKLLEP